MSDDEGIERIIDAEQHKLCKEQTMIWLRAGKPFQFIHNLAKSGRKLYGVDPSKSYWYGINTALDWYNANKKHNLDMSAEFYALKKGAEAVLDYVYTNIPKTEDDEE